MDDFSSLGKVQSFFLGKTLTLGGLGAKIPNLQIDKLFLFTENKKKCHEAYITHRERGI